MLESGFRPVSPRDEGLFWGHNVVTTRDGRTHHRWYWSDPDNPSVPVSTDDLKEPVDTKTARSRIAEIDRQVEMLGDRSEEYGKLCRQQDATQGP